MYLWLTDVNPLLAVILFPCIPLIFGVCGYLIGKKHIPEERKNEVVWWTVLGILIGLQFTCFGSLGYWAI
jgi:hypothetical protein